MANGKGYKDKAKEVKAREVWNKVLFDAEHTVIWAGGDAEIWIGKEGDLFYHVFGTEIDGGLCPGEDMAMEEARNKVLYAIDELCGLIKRKCR